MIFFGYIVTFSYLQGPRPWSQPTGDQKKKKKIRKFQKERLEFAGRQQLLGIDTMDKNLGKLQEMVRDSEA